MSGVETLQARNSAISIESHYIKEVLEDAGKEIFEQQSRVITNANSDYKDVLENRSYTVQSTTLTLSHSLRERFIDMKKIKGKTQKSLQVHNTIIWSQFNVIVGKLKYGFTSEIKNAIKGKFNIDI